MGKVNNVISDIKNEINCIDYLNNIGISLDRNGETLRTYSLFEPGNNDTCFTIWKNNPDYFTDFKANIKGDVIDLCAEYEFNGNLGLAIKELAEKTGINEGDFNTSKDLKKLSVLPDRVNYWNNLLFNPKYKDILKYIRDRLGPKADKTISELKIGYSDKRDRIMIPYLKNGRPVYFCGRLNPAREINKDNPKYYKANTAEYGGQILWGIDTVFKKDRLDKPIIIAEGAFDAITFYQEGYSVLSSITGNFSREQKKELLVYLRQAKKKKRDIIVIFDNDEAGNMFDKDMAMYLFNNKIPFKVAFTPNYKDVSEYYQANKEVEGILKTAIDGLAFIVKDKGVNKAEFEEFIKSIYRNTDSITLGMIFEYAGKMTDLEPEWLKQLKKFAEKTPLETAIVSEITKQHELLFFENSGFYEYDKNVWTLKNDTTIKGYIKQAMGKFATGSKVKTILELTAAEVNSSIEFNKKPLMNFQNGTLELETGRLRRPSSMDYLTVMAEYDYDPQAKCEKWLKYLEEVTSASFDKMSLLQEVAGYCLFTDNRLHKCVYLIGEGRNGKSLFLDILEALFSKKNVTRVSLHQMDKDFYRVELKDSILNIAADEKFDASGSESYFKKLVAGDPIDGALKYKNPSYFRTRAKLAISANGFIKFKDPSKAIIDRMIFVSFNERYIQEPVRPNEHKPNINLFNELVEELPGIFNWMYEGYKRLKKNNKFTVTQEGNEILKEFGKAIDPIKAFIDEFDFNKYEDITREDMYYYYRTWATDKGYYRALTNTTFTRRFKEQFLETHTNWREYRNKKSRGYEKEIIIDEDFKQI